MGKKIWELIVGAGKTGLDDRMCFGLFRRIVEKRTSREILAPAKFQGLFARTILENWVQRNLVEIA